MLGKWLGRIAFLMGVITLLIQFTLIPLGEKALTGAVSGLGKGAMVSIKTFPPWELLQGRLDEVSLRVEHLQLGGLTMEQLEGRFTGVELSWWVLWNQKTLNFSFKEPGEVIAVLTEEGLEEYLEEYISRRLKASLEDLRIKIEGQQLQLTAEWTIAGQKLPLLLIGRLELEGTDAIRLVPEKIQVGSFAPGSELRNKLLGNSVFPLPLEGFPMRLEMYELQGKQGKIMVKGSAFPKNLIKE